MKIRGDFVTNSSSSSFILVFDTKKDMEDFYSECDYCNYPEMQKLVSGIGIDTLHIMAEEDIAVKDIVFELLPHCSELNRLSENLTAYLIDPKELKKYESLNIEINTVSDYVDGVVNIEDYNKFKDFIAGFTAKRFKVKIYEREDERSKDDAIEKLTWWLTVDKRQELINRNVVQLPDEEYRDYLIRIKEFENSDKFKSEMSLLIENNAELQEKIQRIKNAYAICNATIWDTSGGLLEWAIRNGFIEQNFPKYNVIVKNIG